MRSKIFSCLMAPVMALVFAMVGWQANGLWTATKQRIRASYERDVTKTSCLVLLRLHPELEISEGQCDQAAERAADHVR